MNFNRQDSRPTLIALQDQFLIDEIRRRKSSGDMSISVNGNESNVKGHIHKNEWKFSAYSYYYLSFLCVLQIVNPLPCQ